jgi:putative redox protein
MARPTQAANSRGEAIVVEETGLGPFQLRVRTGSVTFHMDEPIAVGGMGAGPNPYDLFSAALAASSISTMRVYASTRKWRLDSIRVRLVYTRNASPYRDAMLRQIALVGPLTEAQRNKLLQIVERCPVQLSLGRALEVRTELLSEAALDHSLAETRGEHMRQIMKVCEE